MIFLSKLYFFIQHRCVTRLYSIPLGLVKKMKMKKILIPLFCIVLFCIKSYSQSIPITNLHYLIFTSSLDDAQTYLKDLNFEFNGSGDSKLDNGEVLSAYTFLNKKTSDELVLYQQKNSTTTMFKMLAYYTLDANTYFSYKKYSDVSLQTIPKKEEVNKDCITITYTDKTLIKKFSNCSENGRSS